MLQGRPQLDPLVAEAGLQAGADHPLEDLADGFVADPVVQLAAGAHVLQREQVAALVVHAGQAVADELLGDVRQSVAPPLIGLRVGEGLALAHLVERRVGPVGDAAVQVARRIPVVGPAGRVRRGLGDPRHLQSPGVVEPGVPAAMAHHHRVNGRDLVQVVNI